jgi:molecular chaperone GrpE
MTEENALPIDPEETPDAEAREAEEAPASESAEISVEEIALLRTDEIREALAKAKERDTFLDRLQRLQAEYENYRKRVAREREGYRRSALQGLLLEVLQVVDNFERAVANDPGPDGHADFVRGIELVEKQLTGVLESFAVRPIEAAGRPFDPACHDAVATVTTDELEPNTVVEELLRGYKMDDVVLRPTRVCVAQPPEPAAPAEDTRPDEPTQRTPDEADEAGEETD